MVGSKYTAFNLIVDIIGVLALIGGIAIAVIYQFPVTYHAIADFLSTAHWLRIPLEILFTIGVFRLLLVLLGECLFDF